MKYTVQATQVLLNKKPKRMKQLFLVEANSTEEAYQKCETATKDIIFKSGLRKVPVLDTRYTILNG
jgi:hypothetical protein